jgi:dienelactone hydrolase
MERKKASDFDPQLLSLFHRYVHEGISRREFLDGAAKFAVGGLTATALWDMLRPNYALAQQVKYEAYVYPKTNHGFHNDTTPRYDEAAAKLAWQRTIDHFNKYLKS